MSPIPSAQGRSVDVTRSTPFAVLLLVAACTPVLAAGQSAALAIEVAGGVAIPTGSLASGTSTGEGVTAGPSLGVSFVVPRSDRVALGLGFTQHRFGCTDAGCGDPDRYVVTGLNLGLRVSLVPGSAVDPWLSAGLITAKVESPGLPAPNGGVSSTAMGGEAGAGLAIVAGRAVSLRPAVGWAFASPDLPDGDTLALRYLTARLVIEVRF